MPSPLVLAVCSATGVPLIGGEEVRPRSRGCTWSVHREGPTRGSAAYCCPHDAQLRVGNRKIERLRDASRVLVGTVRLSR